MKSTWGGPPCELIHEEEFASRTDAMRRERYLKTGKRREEIREARAIPENGEGLAELKQVLELARSVGRQGPPRRKPEGREFPSTSSGPAPLSRRAGFQSLL